MIVEFGHLALVLALMAALLQSSVPLIGAARGWTDFMRMADQAALIQCGMTVISFAALTYAFIVTDFSVSLVAENSHSLKPMLYKITGVWGNHEGSMLLWVMTLALFGGMIALFGRNLPPSLKARTLAVQGMIGAAFLAFILLTSNPFTRLDPPAFEGGDLNPILQDIGLALHPPFLYLGYVGLSTAFSFAVAAMLEGRIDATWARWVRPWTLAAWAALTVGIALGSYWAYYELGWGGWWFWDPVENASFMPWLAATALLHSAVVAEKRGELKSWTILLAILAFSLSLLGTFLVRSGVITSVHAFASDPTRGVFILLILFVSIGGALALYARRASEMGADGLFAPVSRESALLLNNVLLTASAVAVFAGTMAPIVYEAFGKIITVGPPFYDMVFGAKMVVLLLVLPIGSTLKWKRAELMTAVWNLWVAWVAAALFMLVFWTTHLGVSPLAPIGGALGVWVVVGALSEPLQRGRLGALFRGETTGREALGRILRTPRSDWGKALAHAGLGVTTFGIALSTALSVEDIRRVDPGDRFELGGYSVTYEGVRVVQGPNFRAQQATVIIQRPGEEPAVLQPEKRFFPSQRTTTSEVALSPGFARDLYVVLGERDEDGRWSLTTRVKPFISWIFIGALIMALGGAVSLLDRRHRIGAPAARRKPAAAPPPAATPAE